MRSKERRREHRVSGRWNKQPPVWNSHFPLCALNSEPSRKRISSIGRAELNDLCFQGGNVCRALDKDAAKLNACAPDLKFYRLNCLSGRLSRLTGSSFALAGKEHSGRVPSNLSRRLESNLLTAAINNWPTLRSHFLGMPNFAFGHFLGGLTCENRF